MHVQLLGQAGEQHTGVGHCKVLHASLLDGILHFVFFTHTGGGQTQLQVGTGTVRHESFVDFLHSGTTGTTGSHCTHGLQSVFV